MKIKDQSLKFEVRSSKFEVRGVGGKGQNARAVLLIIGCLLIFACSENKNEPSIPDDQMARIMADMCIAEAATNGLGGYQKDSLMQVYFKQALDLHGLPLEEYERNLRLYSNEVPRMRQLMKNSEALLDTVSKNER